MKMAAPKKKASSLFTTGVLLVVAVAVAVQFGVGGKLAELAAPMAFGLMEKGMLPVRSQALVPVPHSASRSASQQASG
eukprot:SAG11_NODE_1574_length_4659_cov_4.583333_2_plen_78_part_00